MKRRVSVHEALHFNPSLCSGRFIRVSDTLADQNLQVFNAITRGNWFLSHISANILHGVIHAHL